MKTEVEDTINNQKTIAALEPDGQPKIFYYSYCTSRIPTLVEINFINYLEDVYQIMICILHRKIKKQGRLDIATTNQIIF